MTWEPMTEDAVFRSSEELLLRIKAWYGGAYNTIGNAPSAKGLANFFATPSGAVPRDYITHFARITNPNEEKP